MTKRLPRRLLRILSAGCGSRVAVMLQWSTRADRMGRERRRSRLGGLRPARRRGGAGVFGGRLVGQLIGKGVLERRFDIGWLWPCRDRGRRHATGRRIRDRRGWARRRYAVDSECRGRRDNGRARHRLRGDHSGGGPARSGAGGQPRRERPAHDAHDHNAYACGDPQPQNVAREPRPRSPDGRGRLDPHRSTLAPLSSIGKHWLVNKV